METSNTPQMPYIIQTGGNSSAAKSIVAGVLLVAGIYFGNKAYKAYQLRQGEKNLDTPEGQIALQLKNVFDSTIVSDEDFRQVYLQVHNGNKDAVYTQYRLLTQRNLSDDIAKRIGKDTLTKAVKTEAINSKIDGLIKINSNEDIEFMVSGGSKVKLTNPNKSVTFYPFTDGLIWDLTANELRKPLAIEKKVKFVIPGGKAILTVKEVKLLPYDGAKFSKDWTKYFRPVVKTRKVFALVRVELTDKAGKKKLLWADAREFSKAAALKGLGDIKSIEQLIY